MKFLIWFRSITRPLFLFGIALVIVGLLYSKLLISIGSFTILGTWIIDWDMKNKLRCFIANPIAIGISLLFLLHVFGLLYTSDFDYGMKDIRIKLPLLMFPLVFATSRPLEKKAYDFFKSLFLLAVFVSTLIGFYLYFFGGDFYSSNTRNISVSISHIRLALMVCISFFVSVQLIQSKKLLLPRILLILLNIWLCYFLLLLESFTGLLAVSITGLIVIIRNLYLSRKKKYLGAILGSIGILLASLVIYLVGLYDEFDELHEFKELPYHEFTLGGEKYAHPDLYNEDPLRQNGYVVYQNIAWDELIAAWEERSAFGFDSSTIHGGSMRDAILWYLASKGLNKDHEAINSLSQEDITAIENGVANHAYLNRPGLEIRILETFWEFRNYMHGGDFNGHSVIMRVEFWRTAFQIFKKNWLLGVGTGDIKHAFEAQYEINNTILEEQWRLRTHNQYLTIAVTFGSIGLIIALYALFIPFRQKGMSISYLAFSSIILLSMLNEDTLETQVGATLYAFFNAYLLFLKPLRKDQIDS